MHVMVFVNASFAWSVYQYESEFEVLVFRKANLHKTEFNRMVSTAMATYGMVCHGRLNKNSMA